MTLLPGAHARAQVQLVIEKVEVSYQQGLPDLMTITGVNFGTDPGTVMLPALILRHVTQGLPACSSGWGSPHG
jgi:hypothetical protein